MWSTMMEKSQIFSILAIFVIIPSLYNCTSSEEEFSVIKKRLGDACEDEHDCPVDDGLTCIEGVCACNENVTAFNTTIGKCVGKAKHPCIEEVCVSNACCVFPLETCRCLTGFMISPSGLCVVGHGDYCHSYPHTSCYDGLKCKNGKCVCKYENHQYYSPELKKCISYVGGPCTPAPIQRTNETETEMEIANFIPCIKHSSCFGVDTDAYKCVCDPGWVESPERTCDIKFGGSCTTNEYANETEESHEMEYCDRFVPLACIDGKCVCDDELKIYDETSMRCRGLVGAVCSASQPDCIRGAKCEPRKRFRNGQGVCQCMPNCDYLPENRSCQNCPFETSYYG